MFHSIRSNILNILIRAIVIAHVLSAPDALLSRAQEPWFGTWNLNLAKSTYDSAPPFRRVSCRIEPWEDGLKVSYDVVGTRGGVTHLEWTGKFDGRDYPVQGMDSVVTNAYIPVDERTFDVVAKADGRPSSISRSIVSADGQTITTVTTRKDEHGNTVKTTVIYDKR